MMSRIYETEIITLVLFGQMRAAAVIADVAVKRRFMALDLPLHLFPAMLATQLIPYFMEPSNSVSSQ
jgi:hypothetical protein